MGKMDAGRSRSNGRPLRVGVIGAGRVSKHMHLPVLKSMSDVKVSWICDQDRGKARNLAKLFQIPAAHSRVDDCDDVDVVLVGIPVGLRRGVMDSVFRRGWNVFCEKPFAISRQESDDYLSMAHRHGVQIGVGFLRRYGSATVTIRNIIREGYFGRIFGVWAGEGNRTKRTGQESDWYLGDSKSAGGGVLMETGSHLIDQVCSILDATRFDLNSCMQHRYKGIDLQTQLRGVLSNARQDDLPCTFEVSRLRDLCNGIYFKFSEFVLKCGLFFHDPLEMYTADGNRIARLETDGGASTIAQAVYCEWRDFLEQCRTGIQSSISAETAGSVTQIIEQCYRDAKVFEIGNAIQEEEHG